MFKAIKVLTFFERMKLMTLLGLSTMFLPFVFPMMQLSSLVTVRNGSQFGRSVDELLNNNLKDYLPIFIYDTADANEYSWLIQDHLLSTPHINGFPGAEIFDEEKYRFNSRHVFIVWAATPKDFFRIINTLSRKNLLNFEQNYIFHSKTSLFPGNKYIIDEKWLWIKNVPRSLIIEDINYDSTSPSNSWKQNTLILKYDMFHSMNEFKKVFPTGRSISELGYSLFNSFPNSFGGRTLRVTLKEYFPCTIAEKTSNGSIHYTGSDINLLNTLSGYLNFRFTFQTPPDNLYGRYDEKTNTTNGMVFELVANKADISIGCLAYSPDRYQVIKFIHPLTKDCLSFVSPKANAVAKWKVIALALQKEVWIGFFVSLIFIVFFIKNITHLTSNFIEENSFFQNLYNSSFTAIQYVLQISPSQDSSQSPARLLLAMVWLFSIVLAVGYRSMLTSLLSVPMYGESVNTLEELANSDLVPSWMGYGGGVEHMFRTSKDPVYMAIWNRIHIIESLPDAIENVRIERKSAVIDAKDILKLLIRTSFTDPVTNDPMVHQATECFRPFSMTVGFQKTSPYISAFDRAASRLVKTGVIMKWGRDLEFKEKLKALKQKHKTPENKNEDRLNIKDLQGGFLCYFIGTFCSVVCFVVELIVSSQKIK